jgi:hypothetical protein
MKKVLILSIFAGFLAGLFQACNNESPAAAVVPLTIESKKMAKKEGPDCDKPDTLRLNCAEVNLSYPELKNGNDALKKAIADWANSNLLGLLAPETDPDKMTGGINLDSAINTFFESHKAFVAEMPDAMAYYVANVSDTILLNNGKDLTLRLDCYSFTGGAHGNPYTAIATWDAATGTLYKLENMFTDLTALQTMAEKKFRETKPDLFLPEDKGGWGFNFDETFPFKLADNYGLTDKGLFLCYVPYEVGPYAIGQTEFVIPFEELKPLMK